MINKIRENKDKEFKKLKERYDDERRRESEQYQFEYEKLKNEISLLQRRLGQEETYTKELAIINNKLSNNMSNIKEYREVKEESKTYHHFYPKYEQEDEGDDDEITKRKIAWAELEREQ